MKVLVDANLSPTVAEALRQAGHDATHVVDHGLMAASDEEIAAFAVDHVQVIVSADSDFASMHDLSHGTAPSLVLFDPRITSSRRIRRLCLWRTWPGSRTT